MIAILQQPLKMTVEEYLEWEPQQDVNYEYIALTNQKSPPIQRNLYHHST